MAHGEKTQSRAWRNEEYWTRRPLSRHGGYYISHRAGTNKITKRITHKIERAEERVLVRREVVDARD